MISFLLEQKKTKNSKINSHNSSLKKEEFVRQSGSSEKNYSGSVEEKSSSESTESVKLTNEEIFIERFYNLEEKYSKLKNEISNLEEEMLLKNKEIENIKFFCLLPLFTFVFLILFFKIKKIVKNSKKK